MKYTYILLVITCLSSCASKKELHEISSIQFGSGGGFTGAVTTYHLKSDLLYKIEDGDTVLVKKVNDVRLEEAYQIAKQTQSLTYHQPGNMYNFIEIDFKESDDKRFTWGVGSQLPPHEITDLYELLRAFATN